MHIGKIIAAAVLALTGIAGTSTAASAHTVTVSATMAAASASVQRGYYRDDDRRWDRGDSRRWDRGDRRRWDRGDRRRWDRRSYNRNRYYRGGSRRVCWNEWRRGHRVAVCRRR